MKQVKLFLWYLLVLAIVPVAFASVTVTPGLWSMNGGAAIYASQQACIDAIPTTTTVTDVCSGSTTVTVLGMPFVDTTLIPAPAVGSTVPQVQTTWVDPLGWKYPLNPSCTAPGPHCTQSPNNVIFPSDVGAFRESAKFAMFAQLDPIVSPGVAKSMHLHAFWGNTHINKDTTAASLMSDCASTSAGGTLNCTAYWVPALIDTRTGRPIVPTSGLFYYKTGYNGIAPADIKQLPAGLRMVSGNAHATSAAESNHVVYGCIRVGNGPGTTYWNGPTIPNCVPGSLMTMAVNFPQCWDGVNLDSPDHISHMSTTVNTSPTTRACPADHPVPLPEVSFSIDYLVGPNDDPTKWRLASDMYDPALPAGYSGHGDWFNGWDSPTMATITANCHNRSLDCHANLLGDGRTLY